MKSHTNNFKEAQTTIQFLLGPIKIKDGLFMGDQLAAKDIEFIISNKVTHVINTVSKTIPNLYQRFGIQYLSVHWTQKEQNIFDKKNNAVNAIFSFIQQAMQVGESCLIHSVHGKSRSCAVLVAYLMKKYSWSLNKCLEFVNSKKEGLEIRNNYLSQMQQLQKRLLVQHKLSNSWNQIKNQEDLILANTFYNSKKMEKPSTTSSKKQNKRKVTWNQKIVQKPVVTNPLNNTINKPKQQFAPKKLRSILKGDLQFQKQEQNIENEQFSDGVKLAEDRFISSINGNIVHVTVNNFINTEKKPPANDTAAKTYNTRPFSSDAKDREKKAQQNVTTNPINQKLFPYDTSGMATTFKNPYEMKMIGKIGTNLKNPKKKEEIRNPIMAYQRPISANIKEADKKKGGKMIPSNPVAEKLGIDMMVTNSTSGTNAKKRFPSSNPKDDPYKWK